jgi:hypothetical protein
LGDGDAVQCRFPRSFTTLPALVPKRRAGSVLAFWCWAGRWGGRANEAAIRSAEPKSSLLDHVAAPKGGSAAPALQARAWLSKWPALAAALALALLAAGAFAWRAGYAPRFMAASVDDKLANAPHLSIVVLPFENLSENKDQDYFADAITEDLTTDLSHLQDAFVISRGTAFTYKGKPADAKEIGKDLGVRYVLEGRLCAPATTARVVS